MNRYELVISGGSNYRQEITAAEYTTAESYDDKWTDITFLDEDSLVIAEARVAANHSYSIVLIG